MKQNASPAYITTGLMIDARRLLVIYLIAMNRYRVRLRRVAHEKNIYFGADIRHK